MIEFVLLVVLIGTVLGLFVGGAYVLGRVIVAAFCGIVYAFSGGKVNLWERIKIYTAKEQLRRQVEEERIKAKALEEWLMK